MSKSDAAEPSDALRKQLESDAGPHATRDQERAAKKRRDAARVSSERDEEARTAPPAKRTAPRKSTS